MVSLILHSSRGPRQLLSPHNQFDFSLHCSLRGLIGEDTRLSDEFVYGGAVSVDFDVVG
jgi:hypothetical protein